MHKKLIYLLPILLQLPLFTFAQKITFDKYEPGEGVTMRSGDDSYRMNMGGFIQTITYTHFYEGGDDDLYTRYRIKTARVRITGTALNDKLSYRLTTDFAESLGGDDDASNTIKDAYIKYNATNNWSITVGQKSLGTDCREMTIGTNTLAFVSRSKLASAFSTIREVGVFLEGTVKVGSNSYIRPSLIITDGDGGFSSGERSGGLKYGGRINYLPFGRFRGFGEFREVDMVRELSPKLSVGTAFSYNNATSDRRGGRSTGSLIYLDKDEQYSLPSYSKFVADFLFKYRGLSVLGEYTKTWEEEAPVRHHQLSGWPTLFRY